MKNRSTLIFIFILFLFVIAFGYNYFKQPFLKKYVSEGQLNFTEVVQEVLDPPSPNSKQTFLENMTTREKISQVLAVPVTLENSQAEKEKIFDKKILWLKENHPGLIVLFGEKIGEDLAKSSLKIIKEQYADSNLSPIIAVDHEGGTVQRLSGNSFTILPSWKEVCEMDTSEFQPLFEESAQELSKLGVNIVFAPVLDLSKSQKILRSRVCGDYVVTLERAQDYILAFSERQIMPVVKHFPGIGTINYDLHRTFDEIEPRIEDTQAFKNILDRFPNIGLMTTHVGIKGKLEGAPCSLSELCLEKMLELYPGVVFFTDALEMESARYQLDSSELKPLFMVAKEAVYAGNNVLVFGENVSVSDLDEIMIVLEKEYNDSDEFKKKIDISVAKILILKEVGK